MISSPAPYITEIDLVESFPLGVSWLSLGQSSTTKVDAGVNSAALAEICRLGSAQLRGEVQQEVRCSLVTERQMGPGHRIGVLPNGLGRFTTSFFPISKIVAGAVSAASGFPKAWTAIPAGNAFPEESMMGPDGTPAPFGGGMNAVLITPSYFGWGMGRLGTEVQLSYLHGWPATQLVVAATEGATSIAVDELAGLVGARVVISDGVDAEQVTVVAASPAAAPAYSSTALYFPGTTAVFTDAQTYQCLISNGPGTPNGVQPPSAGGSSVYWAAAIEPVGPGTATLAAPLADNHPAGVAVTALPYSLRWATALYTKALALQRGLATVSVPGSVGRTVSTDEAIDAAIREAVATANPYRRVFP